MYIAMQIIVENCYNLQNYYEHINKSILINKYYLIHIYKATNQEHLKALIIGKGLNRFCIELHMKFKNPVVAKDRESGSMLS